jgi:hypothetical protein
MLGAPPPPSIETRQLGHVVSEAIEAINLLEAGKEAKENDSTLTDTNFSTTLVRARMPGPRGEEMAAGVVAGHVVMPAGAGAAPISD